VKYEKDFRDEIAMGWPAEMEKVEAKRDWGMNCSYDYDDAVQEILREIREKVGSKVD